MKSEFHKLLRLSNRYILNKPFLVGGVPRDFVLGTSGKTFDYDITTNNADSIRLGVLFSEETDRPFRLFQEGNLKVMFDKFSYDFSSNFESDGVIKFLNNKGSGAGSADYETYSRDFTINTLQQDMDSHDIMDPTGMGVKDIEDGIIRTPVPAEITLIDDPRRIFRAINFSARYGMDVDSEIINFVRDNNKEIFNTELRPKDSFIVSKVGESISNDADRTIQLLDDMNILDEVPLEGLFKEQIIKRRMVLDYLD